MTWDYMSWEAFAALLTGVLAVGAALVVGLRQVGISTRQTEILSDQALIQDRLVGIEELKLRHALFEDRIEIYDATREFLETIVRNAEVPGLAVERNEKVRVAQDKIRRNFTEAIDRSRFLFRPSVSDALNDLWLTARLINFHQKMQKDVNGRKEHGKHVDGEHAALTQISKVYLDLASVFGDELTLSAHGATFAPKPVLSDTAKTK